MSITRIASQQSAFQSASNIGGAGNRLASSSLTLSTGQRINSAGDDPAGFSLARTLSARGGGLTQSIANIGNATNALNIAESGLVAISDLTLQISERAVQAADGSLSDGQRAAIQGEIDALVAEIDDIARETSFQDQALIDGTFTDRSVQTGPDSGDTFNLSIGNGTAEALGLDAIDVTTQAGASAAIDQAAQAQADVTAAAQEVGQAQTQLRAREDNLVATALNNEAVRSRVEDADVAEELLNSTRNQILLQSAIAAEAQGNASAQEVLKLF